MKSNLFMPIFALVVAIVGGLLFAYYNSSPKGNSPATATSTTQTAPASSTATDYDSCIAEGGKPLPEDSSKCLTVDGHIFIQGVIE